jgi:hypothetical protein
VTVPPNTRDGAQSFVKNSGGRDQVAVVAKRGPTESLRLDKAISTAR